jgi:hypothetical protein
VIFEFTAELFANLTLSHLSNVAKPYLTKIHIIWTYLVGCHVDWREWGAKEIPS